MTQTQSTATASSQSSTTAPERSTMFTLASFAMAAACLLLAAFFGYEAIHSAWQILKHSFLLVLWVLLAGAALQGISLSLALRHRKFRSIKDTIGVLGGFLTIIALGFKANKLVGTFRHHNKA